MRSDLGKCDVMWAKKTQTLKSAFECHLVAKPCCQMWWDEFVLRCYIYFNFTFPFPFILKLFVFINVDVFVFDAPPLI